MNVFHNAPQPPLILRGGAFLLPLGSGEAGRGYEWQRGENPFSPWEKVAEGRMRGTLAVMSQKSSRGKNWLYGLVLLILVFLVGMIFSLVKAAREGSPVVDRDYYRHGLVYAPGDVGGAAARLGWRAEPSYRNGRLELRITDRNGAPVTGGTLTVTIEGKGAPAGTLTCGIEGPGMYCVPLIPASGAILKAGWIFRRGSDIMSGRMTVLP